MGKVLGVLSLMVISGVVTFLVTIYIMMDLGSRYHGNYTHYDKELGALIWIPIIIGFLAPGVLAGLVWLWRNRNEHGS